MDRSGPDQVQALAKELGIKLFPAYADGKNLYYRNGVLKTYSGDIPPADGASLSQLVEIIGNLNTHGQGGPGRHPWTAAQAEEWDSQTIATWIAEQNFSEEAAFLGGVAIRGVYGRRPRRSPSWTCWPRSAGWAATSTPRSDRPRAPASWVGRSNCRRDWPGSSSGRSG